MNFTLDPQKKGFKKRKASKKERLQKKSLKKGVSQRVLTL
ncbi:hypothetical protein HPHPA26_1605 [Helicobacter pylori Hp A-26]|uniref:Uncharacterized protein n=1 Tax=Helicobacter pylori Hp A-26 TaxID=992056 RepID=J0MF76_HELPX|nr:hypothetical protein HPHPA26_1605 [Helicobacter pylori Hp A-26]